MVVWADSFRGDGDESLPGCDEEVGIVFGESEVPEHKVIFDSGARHG